MDVGVLTWAFGAAADPALTDERQGWQPENLRKRNLRPATLIDVGAGNGTAPLYAAFPDAYRVLIEPLAEFEPDLQRHANGRGEYVLAAAGEQEGEATLRVDRFRSSIYEATWRGPGDDEALERRTVPVTTLDALWTERKWQPPFGLKIDTEGNEDQVIRGASRLLPVTQFVIAEVSGSRLFRGSYSFAEFIALMDSRGFEVCDLVDGFKAEGGEIAYLDLMFRRVRAKR